MSPAIVLAGLAGCLAAAGIAELAASGSWRGVHRRDRASGMAAALAALLARLGRRIGAPAPPRDLGARIDAAGAPLGLDGGDVMAIKGAGAVVALLAGSPVAVALPGRLPIVALLALPLAGFLVPDAVLVLRARRRMRAMAIELPDLLDLLRVSVQAGLSLGRALTEVGRRHGGMLAVEWSRAAREIELGARRDEALARLVARCPIDGLPQLVAAVARAERHGTPLGDVLAAQAAEARAVRARRIREHAAKAAPKIQLVIALLLVPAVLLLVAAALLASL